MRIVKCLIQRYDPTVKEAPFTFITVGECEIDDPLYDECGPNSITRYRRMRSACSEQGFQFRFYSSSSNPKYEYELTVE